MLFADAESYPQLKAEPAFQSLQEQLAQVETLIAQARQSYNLTVQAFNNAVDTVSTNLVAWFASMEELPFLGADADERDVPQVDMQAAA